MIILHAIWSHLSKLSVWGEDSSLAVKASGVNKQTRSRTVQPKRHPFACEPDWLQEGIGQIDGLLNKFTETDLTLLLPTVKNRPQPSNHLLDQLSEQGSAARLDSWIVPALALDSAEAIDLLLTLPEGTLPGVIIGESFRFFAEVAKLALELVARGRVLPALVKRDEDLLALWRPVTDSDDDLERLRLLSRSMPASCRAESVNGSVEGEKPGALLGSMLESLIDFLVRQSLSASSLLPEQNRRRKKRLPAAEAWLSALTAESATITGESADLIKLQKALGEWGQGALSAAHGAFRICFRLSPPEGDKSFAAGGKWRLEFLLQATDDRSLIVSADLVWKSKGSTLTFLKRRLENPQERLLEGLGRAMRLYPDLESALKTAKPVAMELDTDGAYRFLRDAVPLLEQSGFGVRVPYWWKKPETRLAAKLKASPKGASTATSLGLVGLDSICNYQWEISLGEEKLSLEDFKKLAKLKVPLVQIRGQWVELRKEEVDRAIAFFEKRKASGQMTAGEVLRIGIGLEGSKIGLPVAGVETEGWLTNLLGSNGERSINRVKTPGEFKGKLRPYQERGLSWLLFFNSLGLGGCLADDMGLGKTIELLALLVAEREGNGSKKASRSGATLLICPMSVVGNWQRETERFAPMLKVHVHHGAGRLTKNHFVEAVKKNDLVITTYALAARDQKLLAGIDWHRVVLDEAQNIKNTSAKQTQAVRSFKAGRRVALTGTPVENRLSELWSIMEFLNPGLLGSASDFRTRFSVPIERYRDEEKAGLLKRLTRPFILRRLKTDKSIIRDLPDKIEMKTFCNLTKEQASLYQAVVVEMLKKIEKSEGIERKGLVLSTLMRLKQVCNHPVHFLKDDSSLDGRSGKLARLEEILEEVLEGNDKALCFTQFAEMGEMLKGYLQERFGREVLYLHGGTSRKERDTMIESFQQENGPPIFLLSLKAGGIGLNLTEACHVIHFDRWWNPAVEDQATDRAFRIGQKKNVQVRKFICVGTVEERIDQMIESKKELADRIVGSGEAWLTELSTAQIRELITLSGDAVSED
jgi:SNF2 family DNA or RNA helicase